MDLQPHKKIQTTIKTVLDGDTVILRYNGQEFSSRARWIDAPETKKWGQSSEDPRILKHWDWAEKSKAFLLNLAAGSQILTIIPVQIDQYNRWVCDWYLGTEVKLATNIQVQLCAAGMSANSLPFQHYHFSASRDLSLYVGILRKCADACKKRVGFWMEPDFILPYEFKKLIL
ncbi:MAG: thermonuclease family protein [Microcoleus vaginatus WJT46-NPBG5]|jgi:endonuclease YncB( thermonuclease family)|nr:thermonuclease family protein [Microcoleus vaginatus WJT46-NPBG5]